MSENKRNDARAGALEARCGCWRTAAEEREQNPELGRAARIFRQIFAKIRYFGILSGDFCSDFDEILSGFRQYLGRC